MNENDIKRKMLELAGYFACKQIPFKHEKLETFIERWEERGINKNIIEKIREYQCLEKEIEKFE
jgi:hypothetical protein